MFDPERGKLVRPSYCGDHETICESIHVALAERLDIPLISAAQKLIRRLSRDSAFSKRMVWVGDLSA